MASLTEREINALLALREEGESLAWRLAETASQVVRRLTAEKTPKMTAYQMVGDVIGKSAPSVRYYTRTWNFWARVAQQDINALRQNYPVLAFGHFEFAARAGMRELKNGMDGISAALAVLDTAQKWADEHGAPPSVDSLNAAFQKGGDLYSSLAGTQAGQAVTDAAEQAAEIAELNAIIATAAAENLNGLAEDLERIIRTIRPALTTREAAAASRAVADLKSIANALPKRVK